MSKITLQMKKKAVQIALSGVAPFDYLKECGSAEPYKMWYSIKENLKKVDPETYKKIPKFNPGGSKPVVDKGLPKKYINGKEYEKMENTGPVASVKISGPITIEAEDPKDVKVVKDVQELDKATSPVSFCKYEVAAIRDKDLGEFYFDRKHNTIDWKGLDGEEVSLSPDGWKSLAEQIPEILGILGVKV